jgi:long-chain acyl-CoA synthetase
MRHKRRGIWQAIAWSEYLSRTCGIASGLERLGLQPGEVLSVVSESRPEWLYADMAIQALGLMSHAVHPTCTPTLLVRQLLRAGTRVAFVEHAAQAACLVAASSMLPRLRLVVVFEDRGLRQLEDPRVVSLTAFAPPADNAGLAALSQRIGTGRGVDLSVLSPSAGQSGEPRMAAFSHATILRQSDVLLDQLGLRDANRVLCFAPLAQLTERLVATAVPLSCDVLVHFPESPATVPNDLREVEPDWVHAPPRFWEKMKARTESAALRSAPRARRLFELSMEGQGAGWLRSAARRQLRRTLGLGRVHRAFSGGAPVSAALGAWYLAIGVQLEDMYESVETCGPLVLGPETARVDASGQLHVRPPATLAGHWHDDALQPVRRDDRGWLPTGDIAAVDAGGRFSVLGRDADRFITSAGDWVSPAAVEAVLQTSSFIAAAWLVRTAQGRCACLLSLEEDCVLTYAQRQGIPFTDYSSLAARPEIHALVQAQIDNLNNALPASRRIASFGLLPSDLDDEVLTAALRIRRDVAAARFAQRLEELLAA